MTITIMAMMAITIGASVIVPALIVANTGDACPASPPDDAPKIAAALAHAPRKEVVYMQSSEPLARAEYVLMLCHPWRCRLLSAPANGGAFYTAYSPASTRIGKRISSRNR